MGTYQAPHAHSIAIDPTTHLLYLLIEDVDGKPMLQMFEAAPPT